MESNINPAKINVVFNFLKLITGVVGICVVSFKLGLIYAELKNTKKIYDGYEPRIDSLVVKVDSLFKWKEKVTAYYYPKKIN